MNTDYVSLETAKLLKEVGFKEECLGFYSTPLSKLRDGNAKYKLEVDNVQYSFNSGEHNPHVIDAPHLYDAQKWLREKHGIDITIHRSFSMDNSYHYCIIIDCNYDGENQQMVTPNRTYEQALDLAIQEACKLIKNK